MKQEQRKKDEAMHKKVDKIGKQSQMLLERIKGGLKKKKNDAQTDDINISSLYSQILNKEYHFTTQTQASNEIISFVQQQTKLIQSLKQENLTLVNQKQQRKIFSEVNRSKEETLRIKQLNQQLQLLDLKYKESWEKMKQMKKESQLLSEENENSKKQNTKLAANNRELQEKIQNLQKQVQRILRQPKDQKSQMEELSKQLQNWKQQSERIKMQLEKEQRENKNIIEEYKRLISQRDEKIKITNLECQQKIGLQSSKLKYELVCTSKALSQAILIQKQYLERENSFKVEVDTLTSQAIALNIQKKSLEDQYKMLQEKNRQILSDSYQSENKLKQMLQIAQQCQKSNQLKVNELNELVNKLEEEKQNLLMQLKQCQIEINKKQNDLLGTIGVKEKQNIQLSEHIEILKNIISDQKEGLSKLTIEIQALKQANKKQAEVYEESVRVKNIQMDSNRKEIQTYIRTQTELQQKVEELSERIKFFKQENQKFTSERADLMQKLMLQNKKMKEIQFEVKEQLIKELKQQAFQRNQKSVRLKEQQKSDKMEIIRLKEENENLKADNTRLQQRNSAELQNILKIKKDLTLTEEELNKRKNQMFKMEQKHSMIYSQNHELKNKIKNKDITYEMDMQHKEQRIKQLESVVKAMGEENNNLKGRFDEKQLEWVNSSMKVNGELERLCERNEQMKERLKMLKEENQSLNKERAQYKDLNEKQAVSYEQINEENKKLKSQLAQQIRLLTERQQKIKLFEKTGLNLAINQEQKGDDLRKPQNNESEKTCKHIQTIKQLTFELQEAYKTINELSDSKNEADKSISANNSRTSVSSSKKQKSRSLKKFAGLFGF